jgi:hypothetical protein
VEPSVIPNIYTDGGSRVGKGRGYIGHMGGSNSCGCG